MSRGLRSGSGGITGLYKFVTEHFDALEADFQREYGLNLSQEIETIETKRMVHLVTGLSPDSALARKMNPESWHWKNEHELLAVIAELLDRHDRHFIRANTEKGQKQPNPIEIARPWKKVKQHSRGTSMSEFRKIVMAGEGQVKRGGDQ